MPITEENIKQKLDKEISLFVKHSKIDKRFLNDSGNVSYSDFLSNKMLIIAIIREGVPFSLFNLIQYYTPFTENDWADILEISTKSLQRYRQTSRQFKPLQSEKIIEMAEVTDAGLDVFGDMGQFKLWLDTPNFSLGNLTPMELLKDSYGKEMVLGELTRINHGIFV
jgi:putative toxin-antitoxin system antitoxin component (TIGR02293 family)